MKKYFSFLLVLMALTGCTSILNTQPSIYPDLYNEQLLYTTGSLDDYQVFWIYSFKTIASLSFLNQKSGTEVIKYRPSGPSKFSIEYEYLGKFALLADSLGNAIASNKVPRFSNFMYFQSSAYLDSIAKANYKISIIGLPKFNKKAIKVSRKED